VGTAQAQGELWGARAADWAERQEPTWRPVYATVLARAGVGPGTRLLDIGCGTGGALLVARERGAEPFGLDASRRFVEFARKRLPNARIEVGEMEQLPFADAAFDVVTGFNSFQFAGDVIQALREARRVCRPSGTLAMLVWGRKQDCDLLAVTLPAILALLPPSPAAAAPTAFAEPGVIEGLMRQAGLAPTRGDEIDCEFSYPDVSTAWRAIASAGPVSRAIDHAGEDAVRNAAVGTLQAFTRADGSVVQRNRFRFAMATPA